MAETRERQPASSAALAAPGPARVWGLNIGGGRALMGPFLDFWLVGGASVVTLAVFWLYTRGLPEAEIAEVNNRMSWWAYGCAFAINYPHFAYSYLLFYPGFRERLTGAGTGWPSRLRLALAGIAVPAAMLAYFAYAWHTQDSKYLAWSVMAMVFSVGWHYVRQGYGVFITLSVYKGVFYGNWEKRILNINAYLVWIYSWVRANMNTGVQPYYSITYETVGIPEWIVKAMLAAACLSTAASAAVLAGHWLLDRKGISFNAVAGYAAAVYLWIMLPYMNMAFYVFIPLFHSLQYLPFVFKFKRSEFLRAIQAPEGNPVRTRRRAIFWTALFGVAGVALGALFFHFIPNYIDRAYGITPDKLELDPQFFLISFIVFINIHHFFIDSAFWRRDNQSVQQYLFRA